MIFYLQQLLSKSATENGRRAKPRNGFMFYISICGTFGINWL
jgi:hypothetical protein